MKKRLKWQKKLKISELKHLKECGINTLREFQETINYQQRLFREDKNHRYPCYECLPIANKLGMKPE